MTRAARKLMIVLRRYMPETTVVLSTDTGDLHPGDTGGWYVITVYHPTGGAVRINADRTLDVGRAELARAGASAGPFFGLGYSGPLMAALRAIFEARTGPRAWPVNCPCSDDDAPGRAMTVIHTDGCGWACCMGLGLSAAVG